MRLDKFLKVTRIIKRRTIAKELADNGNVQVNSEEKKSSYSVKAGDILDIKYFNKNIKIKVFLDKKIPHEAGLGGGSSNAAFILRKLNEKYKLYTNEELEKIALKAGADVPFFIRNKSARVTGIGEKIEEIENNLTSEILLIKPQQGMSTGQVYSYYKDNKKDLKMADIMNIIKALKENNLTQLLKNIENSLEQLIFKKDSSFRDLKNELEDTLAKKIFMSGSGSCFFAFGKAGEFDTNKLDKKNVFYKKTNRLV